MTYDFDQTFIAESFQALYVLRGRPVLNRVETARRFELCEDLAQQIAEDAQQFAQGLPGDEVLLRCWSGLRACESGVSDPEALWVMRRAIEVLEWQVPDWLICGTTG